MKPVILENSPSVMFDYGLTAEQGAVVIQKGFLTKSLHTARLHQPLLYKEVAVVET